VPGHVGANDGAAGTAAVVEIARALRARPSRGAREVRFVLFDGEEEPRGSTDFLTDGLRGSKAYAARHADAIGELVLLDYVAEARGLRFPREEGSDPDLWARLRAAARRVGTLRLFPDEVSGEILDDHWPFTQRGIPAIDLIDFDYPQRDSRRDDLSAVSERSLDAVGETVVELLLERRRAAPLPRSSERP
jgi:Zn-dependent M28 family amino/carboxypeptidase